MIANLREEAAFKRIEWRRRVHVANLINLEKVLLLLFVYWDMSRFGSKLTKHFKF